MPSDDDLTGPPTRGAFLRRLEAAIADARRQSHSLCLLVIDLDHLKSINDHYGHQAGDAALGGVAAILRASLREEDLPGRYGGDEFVALLPATTLAEGLTVAERVRLAATAANIPSAGSPITLRLSLSIGVAAYPEDGADGSSLFAAADRGAYAAKDAGRNAVRHVPAPDSGGSLAAPLPTRTTRLVGRGAELAQLHRLMEAGLGAFVLVEGEAGLGNTRLLDELATLAALRGIHALRARFLPPGHASPFNPLVEALALRIEEMPLDVLRRAVGPWAGELATAHPGLGLRLAGVASAEPARSEPVAGRLGEALSYLISALAADAQGSPFLLLIDDVQWADGESLHALGRLAERRPALPLLMVAAQHPEQLHLPGGLLANPALREMLAALAGRGLLRERLVLTPLTHREATTLCQQAMGSHESTSPLQQRVIEETSGNPLLLLEAVRLVRERGRAARQPILHDRVGALPLSPRAREALQRRLAGLLPDEHILLSLIGGLETHASLQILCDPGGLGEADTRTMLERLEGLRLVRTLREGEHYGLVYPQMRSLLAEAAGSAWHDLRRRAVCALVAQGLPGTRPRDAEPPVRSGRRAKLEAHLLGGCTVRYNERPLPGLERGQRTLVALLALLATPGHCLPRLALCAILWPEEPERTADTSDPSCAPCLACLAPLLRTHRLCSGSATAWRFTRRSISWSTSIPSPGLPTSRLLRTTLPLCAPLPVVLLGHCCRD